MQRKILYLVYFVTAAITTASTTGFRYFKNLEFTVNENKLISVPLDSEVYAQTQLEYDDLRIIDQNNQEIPYTVRKRLSTELKTVREYFPLKITSLTKTPEDKISLTLTIPGNNENRISGLRIDTHLKNFEKKVKVYAPVENGSDEWVEIAADKHVYDYSAFADIRELHILVPEEKYHFLKLEIQDVTDVQESGFVKLQQEFRDTRQESEIRTKFLEQRNFRIDRVQAFVEEEQVVVESAAERSYPLEILKNVQSDKAKQTLITLQSQREPLTGITLKVNGNNFRRQVQVKGIKNGKKQVIAETHIHDLTYENFHQQDLVVEIPERRADEYDLIVNHGDAPYLDIAGVKGIGPVYELIFLAEPAASYRLFYGSDKAEKPDYDEKPLETLLEKRFEPTITELGLQQVNPVHDSTFSITHFINSKWLLSTIIVVMVFTLAWALYHAIRQMDQRH